MRATGITRKVDSLGRIVIPKELRNLLEVVEDKDSFEIFMDGDKVVLQKYQPGCVICGGTEGVVSFRGKNICSDCLRELKAL